MNFFEFEDFLLSEECYINHDVSYIDIEGLQHYLQFDNYWAYHPFVSSLLYSENTIKVEQLEKKFNFKDKTAHMFLNKKNGPSFNVHTDPVEVIIECLDGVKHMEVEGNRIKLNRGQSLQIPANTEHKALNYEKALMISYGIHDTETLDGLRENDRDLQP
jgi:mannose-6-phosphate isomerase-like protein (cupin superfamily)|tara:strand:- start:7471 stop:7950 length:480 start_codon:yes stop_codon:yes gene_type:complete